MEWIFNYKTEDYNFNIFNHIKKNNTLTLIMPTNLKIIKNDIIYIYVGDNYSKIMFKTKCINSFLNKNTQYFTVDLIQLIDDDNLFIENLHKLKLVENELTENNSNNNPDLFKYIDQTFNNQLKYSDDNFVYLNEPRIKTIEDWVIILKTLQNKKEDFLISLLLEVYKSPNQTVFCSELEKKLNTGGINFKIGQLRDIIKKIPNIHYNQQFYVKFKRDRSWNIPFTTNIELNNSFKTKGKFSWVLRPELAKAIEQVFPESNKRILFCNIAYMEYYDIINHYEIPKNGESYVNKEKNALEKYNYHLCEDGYIRGFVETKHRDKTPNTLHIEKIDKNKKYLKDNKIDNTLVIFCAKSPIINKTVIIGWYKNATVYRNQELHEGREYNLICSSQDAILLEENERNYIIPRAASNSENIGFGQSNIWYANDDNHKAFIKDTLDYINDIEKKQIKKDINNINEKYDINLNNCIKNTKLENNKKIKYSQQPEPKPQSISTSKGIDYFPRNKKKAINALIHANYQCEYNNNHISFIRKIDDLPYMEAHHLIPMSQQNNFNVSIDVEENIVSLCSNCHNEIHYGKDAEKLIITLYNQRKELLKRKGIELNLSTLLSYYDLN